MKHPSAIDLEAFACGDEIASVKGHLDTCEACQAFVAKVRDALGGHTKAKAEAAVARAVRGARVTRLRPMWTAGLVAAPLAAAAAILFLVRPITGPAPLSQPQQAPSVATAEDLATSTGPQGSLALSDPLPSSDPETSFKGAVQLAVVRERGGAQARFTSVVPVRPGDRLRLEVALDREQAILGAVLGDDGSYLEMMAEGVRPAGTHLSERSARIDAPATRGVIVIGSQAAIAKARASKRTDGLVTLRVIEESP